ncbi:MAG TPA: hypothetical protein VEX13_07590 [Chloroflexia bacterium]|nr:hypothetical protein [Chloroflexia bacterium]
MHLALVPALILALAGGVLGGTATHPAHNPSYTSAAGLFSIAAQVEVTPTLTISATPTSGVIATITATTAATATDAITPTAAITATTATTSTVEITATATTTVTLSTPVPLPTVGVQGSLQINPFDWNFLTSVPPDKVRMGPFAWGYLALMVALLAASLFFIIVKRPEWKRTNSVRYRAVNRWGQVGLWLAGLGLIFLLLRAVGLDFFNLRIWLYLVFLATLAIAAWFFYWYRTSYPKEMAKYQKAQRARQFMPGSSGKGSARLASGPSTKLPAANKPTPGPKPATPPTTETPTQRPATSPKPGGTPKSQQKGQKPRRKR